MAMVGAQDAAMRMQTDSDFSFQGQGVRVQDPNLVICFIANVNATGIRPDRHSGQEDFTLIGRLDRFVERGFAGRVVENMNLAGVAAGDEEAFAVAAESQTVPALLKGQKLGLLAFGDVDECYAVFSKPAMDSHQAALVRGNIQLQSTLTA